MTKTVCQNVNSRALTFDAQQQTCQIASTDAELLLTSLDLTPVDFCFNFMPHTCSKAYENDCVLGEEVIPYTKHLSCRPKKPWMWGHNDLPQDLI
jgi:hypothetical protein